MTAPEKLTVSGPADILGFIPHALGYWPAGSLVAMTMHGSRLGATLRLDLPAPDGTSAPVQYLNAVRGYLEADTEADGTLLAVFTGDSHLAAGSYDRLLAALGPVLDGAGMPVREAWYVGDTVWRDAWCMDPGCCPVPGRPLQEIRDSALNAEMVYRGSSVGPAPGRQDAAAPPVSALYRAAVLEADAEWERVLAPRRSSAAQFRAVLDTWEVLLAGGAAAPWLPDADRDGFLRASLLVPAWRDAVLIMCAAGRAAAEDGAAFHGFDPGLTLEPVRPQAPDAAEHCHAGEGPKDDFPRLRLVASTVAGPAGRSRAVPGYVGVLMGIEPAVPDWASMEALDRILTELAAPGGGAVAAALTCRGWIEWCRGRGSYAAAHLHRALETEPGYRLAELFLELVGRGTLCGWAARKDAAWQRPGR
ncbi:hypothetical protein NtRootA9_16390 [Arthrobacter sp. NtRootA9]|nr:hypothetical protein NtRootA9_16390 [Arthrobacter sp. NtRootA9]